jgi:hypothetical protein
MSDRVAPITRILWRSAELESLERFTSRPANGGWRLEGLLVLPFEDEPAQISYRVEVDGDWRTRRADVVIERHGEDRRIRFAADGGGGWTLDGAPAESLAGCVDVDLGFTPATNTLPIRRLAIDVGESRSLPVAWLLFPELVVERNQQNYTRLAADRWQYRSDGFSAELTVDAGGHVLRYGDDLWVAVAHRTD